MKKKPKTNKEALILCIIIAISAAVSVFIGLRRNIYHVDEVWSFALADNTSGKYWFEWGDNGDIVQDPLPDPDTFFDHWQSGSIFKDYITVREDERFRYDVPYLYQYTDVSPPLYYCMIHTVSSLFPGQFSIWFGLVPNIIFFVLCIIILYHIAKRLFGNKIYALLAVAFWAFSRAAFSDANYVRMYMLATLEVLLSLMLHLEFLSGKAKKPYLLLIPIFLVNIAGFLTQNYLYVITFFMAAGGCILLLFGKEIKKFFIFGLTELLSVGAAFLIFPAAIAQMTSSGLVKKAVYHAYSGISVFRLGVPGLLLKNMFGVDDENAVVIGKYIESATLVLIILAAAAAVFLLLSGLLAKKKGLTFGRSIDKTSLRFTSACKDGLGLFVNNKDVQLKGYIFFVLLTSLLVIYMISPKMPNFHDRYFFIMMPVLYISIAWVVFSAVSRTDRKKPRKITAAAVAGAVMIALSIGGNFIGKNYFLFHEDGQKDLHEILSGQTCIICSCAPRYLIHNQAPFLMDSKAVYPSDDWDDELIEVIDNTESCCLLVSNTVSVTEEELSSTMKANHRVEYIGSYFLNEDTFDIYRLSPIQ